MAVWAGLPGPGGPSADDSAPLSNTGADQTKNGDIDPKKAGPIIFTETDITAQIDTIWLRGTGSQEKAAEIIRAACVETPEPWRDKHYEHRERFPSSAVDLKTRNYSNPDAWSIAIPGLGCQFFGERLRRIVCDIINATGGTIARVDAAVDLRVSPDDSLESTFQELETVARDHSLRQASGINATDKGTTISFGSRASDRYVRIYDKGAEQGLEWWKWLRYEAEFKGDVAMAMTFDLVTSEDWTELAQRAAKGAIPEFGDHFPRLASHLFDCEAYRPTISSHEVDLDKWIKTVQEQYGGRIQMMAEASGQDPYDIARRLEIFETKPTKRLSRHSGFLACAIARLFDIIERERQS